jgi:hypothetical protein
VDGFLVFPSTQSEWNKLDDFEGEIYTRTPVSCHCRDVDHGEGKAVDMEIQADVYLWAEDYDKLELDGEWSTEIFEKERLEDWLDFFDGMEMIG